MYESHSNEKKRRCMDLIIIKKHITWKSNIERYGEPKCYIYSI